MTEDQLRVYIENQETRARRETVAEEQAKAMHYYLGRPLGTEEEGRSTVISSDVWDVVEGLLPIVLKPFVSSDEVVSFNPVGAEDEEAAKQETDYINFKVTQENDAFEVFMAWAKAGLLQKNGVVKYWWEDSRRVQIETYKGISDDVYTALIADENVHVLQHTEYPGQASIDQATGQQMPGEPTHDFKVRIVNKDGQVKYAVIPPEELLVSSDARSPDPRKSPFLQHRTRKTISALREMGYDVDDDISDAGTGNASFDIQAAARNIDGQQLGDFDGGGDPSMREVWFRESYCLVDYDGDGIAERRLVCMVGTTVLANEEIEEWPFAGWTPYPQLHQFDGRCPADETVEIQDVKSTLWRQSLDNIYTINNNRTFVGNKVNLDDMLDNQIAGIVRVDDSVVGNQAMSMPITPIGQVVQPMIEYLDSAKENRTGFTRYNQGTDANSLNKTATGVRIIAEAGNERVGLVSRCMAEQGMKALMVGIHGLCRRHATKAETIRLRGKWVTIDPRSWQTRHDMTVSVGLGTADKTMQLQAQDSIVKMQAGLTQAGIVSPENIYNAASKYAELTGEKNPDKYFTHPEKMPKKEPPDPMQDPEVMFKAAEVKQKDRALDQHDRELDQADAKLGIESQNAQVDALMRHHELELKTEMHQRDMAAPAATQLQAEQQQHSIGMDVRKQDAAEQGQAHSQTLAEQQAHQQSEQEPTK